ncbi:hypothetical protein [Streptomyces sp. LN590]
MSGTTLKDTMVRAGQSSERAALIDQHSNLVRIWWGLHCSR